VTPLTLNPGSTPSNTIDHDDPHVSCLTISNVEYGFQICTFQILGSFRPFLEIKYHNRQRTSINILSKDQFKE
jgi:hypothetical protein